MFKCSDYYTKFKVIYFILKDRPLSTLVKFVQDSVMSLCLRLQHMDADGGGEFIADYYHPPNKTIRGDTSYFRIFRKHVGLSFLSIVGSRLLADLALT